MTNQHVSFTVTKEPLQAFGPADAFAVEIDGEHGVVVSTHGWGYFFGSLDDDVEIRLLYILPVADFDGGYLDDVVAEDVEASSLGVEEHHFFAVESLGEVLQIGAAGV